MSDFPRHLAAVTPAWLTEVLGRQVTSVEVELIGRFSTELSRLRLRLAEDGDVQSETLVLKRPGDHATQESRDRFAEEVAVYRDLLPKLGLHSPCCYFGEADPVAGEGLLLLEDFGDAARDVDWMKGPSEPHARLAMDALSVLHRSSAPSGLALDWIPDFSAAHYRRARARAFDDAWPVARAIALEVVPEYADVGDSLIGRGEQIIEALSSPKTLLHGDAHFENLPLVDDRILWLDWAGVSRGHPVFDVAVFVVMSFPLERRRESERALVERHARAMGLQPADAWQAYRTAVSFWSMRIIVLTARRLHAHGRDAPGLEFVLRRCAQAAVDLR